MPQFDVTTFSSLLFWAVVIFVLLYLVMARVALPRVAEVMEERQHRIDDDLARAERLRSEAEQVLAEYEKAIADARSQAGATLQKASDEITAEQNRRLGELAQELAKRGEEAEQRIAAAKQSALDNIRNVAAEVAASAAAKLIDVKIDDKEAKAAVAEVAGGGR